MPTTRRQASAQQQKLDTNGTEDTTKGSSTKQKPPVKRQITKDESKEPRKKSKTTIQSPADSASNNVADPSSEPTASHAQVRATGTIERGHIYFFYRLKVQLEEANSLDDIKHFHILLVPRPPGFSEPVLTGQNAAGASAESSSNRETKQEDSTDHTEMAVLSAGADAVPAPASTNTTQKQFRLITVGKKKLPDPEHGGAGKGRKDTLWATVTKVGDNLDELEKGLGEKTYETKTRGTRHEQPTRLVGRGGYAIVNNDPRVPSDSETHLGYHISHPPPSELGEVQKTLGIHPASSFIVQVKNPLAPASSFGQGFRVGGNAKGVEYPPRIMENVFGKGKKGRESYGLRFAPCETTELIDYEGTQLLLIAAREGGEGLEVSLGEGRGEALKDNEEKESSESVKRVFEELGLDKEVFLENAIMKGEWI